MKSDRRTMRVFVPLGLALLGSVIFATVAAHAAQRKVLAESFTSTW